MGRRASVMRGVRSALEGNLLELPRVARVVRPGTYGTNPEDAPARIPTAPTLDVGPLYTGEWREEVNGDFTQVLPIVTGDAGATVNPKTVIAVLRRPWPMVSFAVDLSRVPRGTRVSAGLNIVMRSGRGELVSAYAVTTPGIDSFLIPAAPAPKTNWICAIGYPAGAIVELWATTNSTSAQPIRGDLWGYNVPGYGP